MSLESGSLPSYRSDIEVPVTPFTKTGKSRRDSDTSSTSSRVTSTTLDTNAPTTGDLSVAESTAHTSPPSFRSTTSIGPSVRIAVHMVPSNISPSAIRRASESSSIAEQGESQPLLSPEEEKWYHGPLLGATIRLSILFAVFTALVVGTFYYGLPQVDEVDKPLLHIPKSFADLQALNGLFQKYKNLYPYRIVACGVVSYLYVQTFSLPGSMYISILFGAAYGILIGLLLSCLCDSFGSLLCYTLSSFLAPPLLKLPFYKARIETWRVKIMGDPASNKQVSWDGVFAFLIVLRVAPFPPHWIANFVAPHLGIGMGMFWLSCFIGIAPISVIHVTIGSSLDSMTSAADFHLVSLRNILGLTAVIAAVLLPVALKRIFQNDLGELGQAESALEESRANGTVTEQYVVEGSDEVVVNVVERGDREVDSGVVISVSGRGDPDATKRNGPVVNVTVDNGDRVNAERNGDNVEGVNGYGSIASESEPRRSRSWWQIVKR